MLRRLTQRAGFALLEARPVSPVPLPAERWTSLTCLARLPDDVADRVAETVRGWPGAEDHHVYPATALHVTLLNLGEIDGDDDAFAHVIELLAQTRPVPLVLKGIGVTSHSVFLRAYDQTGRLGVLRRQLIGVTGGRPEWPRRRLAFANVLRFRSIDAAPVINAARATRFGPAEVVLDRAEIVRTDRLFSRPATTVLREVRFRTSS